MQRLIEVLQGEELAVTTRRGGVAESPLLPWVVILFVVAAMVAGARGPIAQEDRDPWAAHLRRVDEALSRQDYPGAIRPWNLAYRAAARTEGWEGIAAVGQAYFRLRAQIGEDRQTAALTAGPVAMRAVFHAVLARALRQGSAEGALRAAEGFTALGDTAMAERSREAARHLGPPVAGTRPGHS